MIGKTFEDCRRDPAGTIYANWEQDGFRCIVMRGPASLYGYIGVRRGNPLYGKHYDRIDVACHGGLTYAHGEDDLRPAGYWWFGWDYAHYGDACFYDMFHPSGHEWTPDEVVAEFPAIIEQFAQLSKI